MSMTIKKKVAPPAASAPALTKPLMKPLMKPVAKPVTLAPAIAAPAVVEEAQTNLIGVVSTGNVSMKYKDGSETEDKEVVQEKLMPTTHATVGVSIGVTRSLGNFESVKMNVSLFLPCLVDAQDIEDTYAQGKEWVDGKINALNAEIDEQLGK